MCGERLLCMVKSRRNGDSLHVPQDDGMEMSGMRDYDDDVESSGT